MNNRNMEIVPSILETGIVRQQASSTTKRELTAKVKALGKELARINQLLGFPKGGTELADWAESINELMPDVEAGHIKFVVDGMKLNLIEYDQREGIQNLFKALESTETFYKALVDENYFRARRLEYIQKCLKNPDGNTPLKRLIMDRYGKIMKSYCEKSVSTTLNSRQTRKELGRPARFYQQPLSEFNPGPFYLTSIKDRIGYFKAVSYTYGHPTVKYHQLIGNESLKAAPLFPNFNKTISTTEALRLWKKGWFNPISLLTL